MKFFNIAGPCRLENNYMLPATERLAAFNIDRLIAQQQYFVLHAPRQTGKTTAMLELARQLTESGEYISAMVSMEVGAAFPNNMEMAENAALDSWRHSIQSHLPVEHHPPTWNSNAPTGRKIADFLAEWSIAASLPLVILIDEADALQDDVLISLLRQLRAREKPLRSFVRNL